MVAGCFASVKTSLDNSASGVLAYGVTRVVVTCLALSAANGFGWSLHATRAGHLNFGSGSVLYPTRSQLRGSLAPMGRENISFIPARRIYPTRSQLRGSLAPLGRDNISFMPARRIIGDFKRLVLPTWRKFYSPARPILRCRSPSCCPQSFVSIFCPSILVFSMPNAF